jgi:hypothetical protein
MPLKLTVGLARKIGRPNYGSLGASCGVAIELAADAIRGDPDAVLGGARAAFAACRRAVDDELARQIREGDGPEAGDPEGDGPEAGDPGGRPGAAEDGRPATSRQVRAIVAIARRRRADLAGLLRSGYGVASPEALTLAEASRVIRGLRPPAAG